MQTVTHDVMVHKASIPLMKGESLRDFTSKVADAGRQQLVSKLNLGTKVDVYMVEAFADAAVFNVYKYGDNVKPGKRSSYYAVTYKRKDDGTFEMGDSTEVIRVTRFEPKKVPITKSAEPVKKRFGNDTSAWESIEKGFWSGVL